MPGPQDHFPEIPTGELMSSKQALTLVALERTGGCLSLTAVFLLCIAYWLVPKVRNVQNTFIVFASVSNIGASIASIIAMDGLIQGKDAALCRTQAFLFQMFMQSDPWWALSMAINVFLVFYFHVSPDSFQKWWWLYCLVCYGGPFVIALALLLVQHRSRGPIYGEATIWCWVDREWDDIRIYTYYMLIWICIAGSLLFYFMVGYHIFRSRNNLRSLSTNKSCEAGGNDEGAGPMFKLPDVPSDNNFYGTVVTEVQVVHSNASSNNTTTPSEPKRAYLNPTVAFNDHPASRDLEVSAVASHFFSTVTSQSPPRERRRASSSLSLGALGNVTRSVASKFMVEDPIKRAYLRTSFLFALSVLVTWIPSSMNRIHSWLAGESPFEYHVATAAVLPLQGLWNAVIFFVTSHRAIKEAVLDRWDGRVTASRAATFAVDDDGLGGPRRRSARDDLDTSNESDEGDIGTLGSDVELRGMPAISAKASMSF